MVVVSTWWFGTAMAIEPYISEPGGEALSTAGAFDGYFYSDRPFGNMSAPAVRGTFSLRVTDMARGKLTAHAALQNGPLNFNGAAWEATETNGAKRITLSGRGRDKAQLTLFVRQDRIWGTMESGGESLTLDGARSVSNQSESLNAYRGYYTVALPAASALASGRAEAVPQGVGYLTLTVGSGGNAKVAGHLADGTSVVVSSRLVVFPGSTVTATNVIDEATTNVTVTVIAEEACVPVFTPLSAKSGWFGALLWLRAGEPRIVATDRDLGWYARWENSGTRGQGNSKNGRGGFQMLLDVCGGYYGTATALASSYLFSAAEPVGVRYDSRSTTEDYVAAAIPTGIAVMAVSGSLKMPKGTSPVWDDGAYNYAGTNSAQATIVGSARTGLFKGMFNVYFDFERNGRLAHRQDRVPYAGVLTPVRDAAFADLPLGMGFYQILDADPALQPGHQMRSFPVALEAAP
jgi:hypothetical protein